VISKKLNLGAKFLRVILHTRRNAIGIDLIKLETIIVILVCELYIGDLRAKIRISWLIRYNEEVIMVDYG